MFVCKQERIIYTLSKLVASPPTLRQPSHLVPSALATLSQPSHLLLLVPLALTQSPSRPCGHTQPTHLRVDWFRWKAKLGSKRRTESRSPAQSGRHFQVKRATATGKCLWWRWSWTSGVPRMSSAFRSSLVLVDIVGSMEYPVWRKPLPTATGNHILTEAVTVLFAHGAV